MRRTRWTTHGDRCGLRGAFIDGMSRVATSVTIVTTSGRALADSDDSERDVVVAADRLRCWCASINNPMDAAIRANGVFGVNALRADQRWVAETSLPGAAPSPWNPI
ncbi:MAG: flavin reductase family protein [Thermomicrobiales bacterium]